MAAARKWNVVYSGGTMRLGGFGNAAMRWGGYVEAPDRDAALAAAAAKRDAAGFETYTRLVSIEERHQWEFTLKGKADARKRERFFAWGVSEHDARRVLEYMPAVNRFAGAYKTLTNNIVSVRQVGS